MSTRPSVRVLSPEASCFIINLEDDSRLSFQLMPEVISESKSAQYDEIPIIGRSLPFLGYSSSGARSMSLSLRFVALTKEGKYSPQWVRNQVRWLEAKVYPSYEEGFVYPPPRLLIVVGDVIGLQCVMTSVNTTWASPWTATEAALPYQAQVDMSFLEYGKNEDDIGHPHDHEDALIGNNQRFEQGTGSIYVDLPLAVASE